MPQQHLIHVFPFILCRELRYFEDIVKFLIFRLRMINNFFQVWGQNVLKRCWGKKGKVICFFWGGGDGIKIGGGMGGVCMN